MKYCNNFIRIANLSRLVEQGAGLTLGQENTVNELMKQKEELTQERDALLQQVVSYRNEIGDYSERVKALETEKSAKDAEIAELSEQIARLKSDGERELRRKERLEKDVKDMKVMLEKKQEEVRQKQLAVNQGEEELGRQALKLRELEFQAQKAYATAPFLYCSFVTFNIWSGTKRTTHYRRKRSGCSRSWRSKLTPTTSC
jgi:chromosome segregation ATPase